MRLFVGRISYDTTDAGLLALFQTVGQVESAAIIKERNEDGGTEPGRSKGFGFVEMPNQEEAEKAIATLDGYELDGRAISVSVAKPREERSGGGGDRQQRGGYAGGRRY